MKGNPGQLKMRWNQLFGEESERKERRHWKTKQSRIESAVTWATVFHFFETTMVWREGNGLSSPKHILERIQQKGWGGVGGFIFSDARSEGKRRGVKKEGDEKNEDQTSGWLGWAVQKGSMWSSVRGSTGGLTNGLHYKRKARWGSDPTGTCEGAAVVPARNKWNNRSGGCARAARSLAASRLRALLKAKELYSHIACFMSSPSLAWMKCSLYFGSARARLQKEQKQSCRLRTNLVAFLPVNTSMASATVISVESAF